MNSSEDNSVTDPQGDVTIALAAISRGESGAADRLLPLVYEELRRIARARVANEAPGLTLQPTALVHEAYLRLLGPNAQFENHAHFFGAAAIAMRRILIERARRKKTARDALGQRRDLADADFGLEAIADPESIDLLALDGALDRLSHESSRLTEVVHLRFFAGLSVEQTAAVMGISPRTIKRDWNYARAWLRDEISRRASDTVEEQRGRV